MTTTETVAKRYAHVEELPTNELVDALVESQMSAVAAVHSVREELVNAIDASVVKLDNGGRLIYLGAGTSGRLAALDAAELPPTFNWPYERAIPLMAGGLDAYHKAAEGAEDSREEAIESLKQVNLNSNDVVIGLAASGRTPYVIAGLELANELGALTISIGNNIGSLMTKVAQFNLIAHTGAEVLAGSTRMKAGTAQKVILTCLSTGIFVRMGYVYKGRMIEMKPTNEKLQDRAITIVSELTGADKAKAEIALNAANSSIKVATLMLMKNLGAQAAIVALDAANGKLHDAIRSHADGQSEF